MPIILILLRLSANINAPTTEVKGRTALKIATKSERLNVL